MAASFASVRAVRAALAGPDEIALLDVREFGQYGEGHPLLAVNVPYSRLECTVGDLVPRRSAPVVVFDDGGGDTVAERAAARLGAIGYGKVAVMAGGVAGWAAAGHTLHKGVNLPSKMLGELVEERFHTPRISVAELLARRASGEPLLLLDGRTEREHSSFTIPGALSCPNGELGLRLPGVLKPGQTVVVHCAGRTRSIIGAETLRAFGVANPVYALENGTQAWELAGYQREIGANRPLAPTITLQMRRDARRRSVTFCARFGLPRIGQATLAKWRRDPERTTYCLDVRTRAEFDESTVAGARHAPGGQLIQATDHWLAVRGARVVVWDDCGIRAAFAALWLARMGWDVAVLEDTAATRPPRPSAPSAHATARRLDVVGLGAARRAVACLVDVRPSAAFRAGHIDGAVWSIRPRLEGLADFAGRDVVVIGSDPCHATLAAGELKGLGARHAAIHVGAPDLWREAGLPVEASPDHPPDEARIDHLFFVAERHHGNLEHARAYLAWETQLTSRLDGLERGLYRLGPASVGD